MEALPAQTIGRYRVLGALGEGAMGEVVRARDERLGRDVAIKRVKNVLGTQTASFHARFEAEARALAALTHPGVVQVYELGVEGDEPYLVMELVDGPSLRGLLKEQGPLPAASVRALGIQLSRALEAAHARGILHRDVKPANVLRAPGGAWKLADFGVAHMPDSEMTSTGQFIGTPAYAAPEALALAQFSPASDIFALASTLAEAATGQKPRRDTTLAELLASAHERIELAGMPAELAAVLAPALALEAAARPSAAELADLLAGSPETGQILVALAARRTAAAARPSFSEQETRAGGAAVQTIGVPDGTAMPGGAVATIGVPDATAMPGVSPQRPGTGHPTPTPMPAMAAPAMAAPATRAGPQPRRVSGKQTLVVAVALVAALVVISRACSEEPARSPAGSVTGGEGGPPLPMMADHPGDPNRYEMPPGLDRKGVQAWAEVANAVNEGKPHQALDKMYKFERRHGESEESARLRRTLEAWARLVEDD